MYVVIYSYTPDIAVNQAEILSRHGVAHVHDAALAFLECTAPFKTVAWEENGEVYELEDHEQDYIQSLAAKLGVEVDEVDGDDT